MELLLPGCISNLWQFRKTIRELGQYPETDDNAFHPSYCVGIQKLRNTSNKISTVLYITTELRIENN